MQANRNLNQHDGLVLSVISKQNHLPMEPFTLGLSIRTGVKCLSNIKVLPWLPCVKLILLQRDFNPYDPFALLIPFLTPA